MTKLLHLEIDAICEDCSYKMKLDSSNVETTTFKTYDEKIVYIIWYKCPKCGRIHYIQIDNDNTKRLLEYSKVALKQAMVYNSKNQTPPNKIKTKLENSRTKLANARLNLMKKYNNTVFKNLQSKEEVKICFSL